MMSPPDKYVTFVNDVDDRIVKMPREVAVEYNTFTVTLPGGSPVEFRRATLEERLLQVAMEAVDEI